MAKAVQRYRSGQVVTLKASPEDGPYKGHNWPEAVVRVLRDGPDKDGRVEVQYSSRYHLDKEDDGIRSVPVTDIRPGRP
jgi:hypothetical protein